MKLYKQKGVTLIELMIGISIGLVITYFVMSIMMTANRSSIQSEGQSQAQEAGRFTASWLTTEIRRAGYTPDVQEPRTQPFANLCGGGGAMPPAAGGACTFETTGVSDRIAVRRWYTALSGVARDAQDCTGVNLALGENTPLVDVYWVELNTGGGVGDEFDDVLRCVTYDETTGNPVAPSQILVAGMEGLQALYGERIGNIVRYVAADQVTNWNLVFAVKIAVLTKSFTDQSQRAAVRSYVLLDGNPYTFNDSNARQIQTTTVFLAND